MSQDSGLESDMDMEIGVNHSMENINKHSEMKVTGKNSNRKAKTKDNRLNNTQTELTDTSVLENDLQLLMKTDFSWVCKKKETTS